jgi:ribosomal protein S18 acetylase RimI-like enzyme
LHAQLLYYRMLRQDSAATSGHGKVLTANEAGEALEDSLEISLPLGSLRLRPERDEDQPFRLRLFFDSRPAEFALLQRQLEPAAFDQLMLFQFQAQTMSYRASFPQARFDIIELDRTPIGRIVVDRPGTQIHIVDQAVVPGMRNRGIGTAIMQALMDEAARDGLPVRLKVASSNDPSMRLYLRLGFLPIETVPFYIEMERKAPSPIATPS